MSTIVRTRQPSAALLTDLYQLTMAAGYFKTGTHQRDAVFHLFFRSQPFGGGYSVACGLATLVEVLSDFRFADDDIAYLRTLQGNDGSPLFEADFLNLLSGMTLTCDVDAIPEGTVVFPHEPLVRVTGPVLQCQLLETLLLNIVNFETLIATKGARICHAAGGDPVLEFGLRRAQGNDGGLAASRAAYVGGCAGTSNVLAGKLYDIPVRGTHAHSWVMTFDDEVSAFDAYARAMPNNCVFLVDTYDTIEGVRNAVQAGQRLRAKGFEMVGIRLDSGDLRALSIAARRILDEAGFPNASIVASNDLDEYAIQELRAQGAKINVWGVGTKLATAFDQPALGGVYKLAAIRDPATDDWIPKIKLSEQAVKVSNPGTLQVRRFTDGGTITGDCLYDIRRGFTDTEMVDVTDSACVHRLSSSEVYEDLLVPVIRGGQVVYDPPSIHESRRRTSEQLRTLPNDVRRLDDPCRYPVGLSRSVHELKRNLMKNLRSGGTDR